LRFAPARPLDVPALSLLPFPPLTLLLLLSD
jgi:hypothetical protein